ncbi:MAG: hypothetical protein KJ718_02020 [Nanoarchaeota archaeon]|nr:hypothetical protein [Nanoarchaeota archaeon]MBU1051311.1 hypothetical protein [Nanoarchaeota archaeon]MBU1988461.1 hypothetical protein [Nanoarchaeota archaeon]
MKKIKKVVEKKLKIKAVREIKKKKDEGDDEIKELTSSEIPLSAEDVERVVEPVAGAGLGGSVRTAGVPLTLEASAPNVQTQEEEETESRHLYDVGRAMGGNANEPQYKPVDVVQTATLREASVGRDFSMGGSGATGSGYPEAQQIEGKIREGSERERKKYEEGRIEDSQTGRRRGRYPWQA